MDPESGDLKLGRNSDNDNDLDGNQPITPQPLFPAYQNSGNNVFPICRIEESSYEPDNVQRHSGDGEANTLSWLSLNSFSDASAKSLLSLQKNTSKQKEKKRYNLDEGAVLEDEVPTEAEEKLRKRKKKKKKRDHDELDTDKQSTHIASLPSLSQNTESGLYAELNQKVFIEETGLALERAYRVDKKPDYENLSFDKFYQKHVARYRTPKIIPLGLDIYRPQYAALLLKDMVKTKRKKEERYFSTRYIKAQSEHAPSFTVMLKEPEWETSDFIPLDDTPTQSKSKQEKTKGVYDDEPEDYLSGISIHITKDSLNKESDVVNIAVESEQTLWNKLSNKKTEEFNRQLRANPKNEELWLEFVAFQDELMKSDPYGRDKLDGKRLEVACFDRKLAILDRALSSNPRSVNIAVLRLNTCQFLWERDKLSAEWKRLIFLHPSQPTVWHHYLQFLQSSFSTFSVQTVIKGFVKAISTLSKVNEGTLSVHTLPEDLEEKLLDLVSEFAHFLLNSGFSERAVATYQALVEFNFFQPNLPSDSSFSEWVAFFEPFWDSGVPRVGENGANGWGEVVTHKLLTSTHSTGFTDLNEKEDVIIQSYTEDHKIWYEYEILRESHHWLPWRPDLEHLDSESCEDPERMVPVEDVTCILFKIQKEENLFRLILHFLRLLGVTLPSEQCCDTNHLNILCIPSNLSFKNTPKPVASFLSSPAFFSMESVNSFVSTFLSQMKPVFPVSLRKELDLIFIKHKVQETLSQKSIRKPKLVSSDIKVVKKAVKSVLSEEANRNCLEMWMEYLTLELNSNMADALKMFSTIFMAQQRNPNIWRFVWSYVKVVLSTRAEFDHKKLLYILSCLTSGEKYDQKKGEASRLTILKARTGFEAASNSLRNDSSQSEYSVFRQATNLVCCVLCYMFFLHLGGFSTAGSVCEKLLSDPTLSPTDRKELHLGRLHLFLFQGSPLKQLRTALEQATKDFPSNLTFLGLLFDIGGGSFFISQTRRIFSSLLNGPKEPSIWEWICAILSEVNHLQNIQSLREKGEGEFPELGIVWRVRSLFEKALKRSDGMCGGAIWRMFMQFEFRYGSPGRAKAVFYRSLQNCPGFKLLYLDACVYFPEDLTLIVELMSEKDVRLRTPLEEVHMLMPNWSPEKAKDAHTLNSDEDDDNT